MTNILFKGKYLITKRFLETTKSILGLGETHKQRKLFKETKRIILTGLIELQEDSKVQLYETSGATK